MSDQRAHEAGPHPHRLYRLGVAHGRLDALHRRDRALGGLLERPARDPLVRHRDREQRHRRSERD
jgi:hypothetical protein